MSYQKKYEFQMALFYLHCNYIESESYDNKYIVYNVLSTDRSATAAKPTDGGKCYRQGQSRWVLTLCNVCVIFAHIKVQVVKIIRVLRF